MTKRNSIKITLNLIDQTEIKLSLLNDIFKMPKLFTQRFTKYLHVKQQLKIVREIMSCHRLKFASYNKN